MGLRKHHIAAAAITLALGCGGKTNGPIDPTPPPAAPTIACPADLTVREVRDPTQPVTFSAPAVTGGTAPVTVTCNPASGSDFPLGTTRVNCAAADAQARAASCGFDVTLNGFTLGVTKYLAVGDSLTSGENGLPAFIDVPNAYPTKLKALLDTHFPGQAITVVNKGNNGERVERTRNTLPGHLAAERPEAVLLLVGYNDLDPCDPGQANSTACKAAIVEVEFGIRDCIQEVKESALGTKYLFVSTITPSGPRAPGSPRDLRIDPAAVVTMNERIRQRVAAGGATLVDAYARFVGHEVEYTSVDGVHLTPAGYQALAEAFFSAIKATVPQTPLLK